MKNETVVLKNFTICLDSECELFTKIRCKELIVDKDGILLASLGPDEFVAMYKEWTYWINDTFEVIEE